MKKQLKTTAQIILAATLLFTACKKKESNSTSNNATTTTTGSTTGAPAPTGPLTAVVSGTNFSTAVWYNNGIKDIYMMLFSKNLNIYTVSAFSGTNKPSIQLSIPFGVGSYTVNGTTIQAGYYGYYNAAQDTLSFWNGVNGTINITQFDTNGAGSDVISKLKGTFSYSTSTNKNITHNVTNGTIDYTK